MADERTYYVLCANNCKFEGMTKEQILAAIEQAVSTGEITNVDTGFVTKIREKNKNAPLSFWVGTSAEYHAIISKDENCFYILTDDTIGADIVKQIEEFQKEIAELSKSYAQFKSETEFITTSHSAMLAGLTNELTAANAKKNKSLWYGSVAYNKIISDGAQVNNISDYRIVIVRALDMSDGSMANVLCTVDKISNDLLIITGTSFMLNEQAEAIAPKQLNIFIKLMLGCFASQQSHFIQFTAPTGNTVSETTIGTVSVNEIIGIM